MLGLHQSVYNVAPPIKGHILYIPRISPSSQTHHRPIKGRPCFCKFFRKTTPPTCINKVQELSGCSTAKHMNTNSISLDIPLYNRLPLRDKQFGRTTSYKGGPAYFRNMNIASSLVQPSPKGRAYAFRSFQQCLIYQRSDPRGIPKLIIPTIGPS